MKIHNLVLTTRFRNGYAYVKSLKSNIIKVFGIHRDMLKPDSSTVWTGDAISGMLQSCNN
jgi:hypothetical protein